MSKIIGVEIGNDNLKFAICSGSKVQKLICEPIPENIVQDGIITIPDAMTEFLRDTRKKYKIMSGSKVAVVIPDSLAFTRKFTIPAMNDEELRLNIPYEFRDFIDQEKGKDNYVYDYCMLDVSYQFVAKDDKAEEDGKKKEEKIPKEYSILASAVKESVLEQYVSMFKKAGFKLARALPYDVSIQNLFVGNKNIPECIAVLDIGALGSKLAIFKYGKYEMGRSFDVGGMHIDNAISEFYKVDAHTARTYKETNFENCLSGDECIDSYNYLAIEVMKVVNFYTTHGGNLTDIYFCGGTSTIEGLKTRIVKATELQPHDLNKINGAIADENDGLGMICHAAIGAAILK